MFIREFVSFYKDRYITVFNEERPNVINGVIHRSSLAILYDKYERKYVGSAWSGSGKIAGFGISDEQFRNGLVTLTTADDFDKLEVTDNLLRQFVAAFRNLVGKDTVIDAFNRLREPLNQFNTHIRGVTKKERAAAKGLSQLTIMGRAFSYSNKKNHDGRTISFGYHMEDAPTNVMSFASLPDILPDYRPVITPAFKPSYATEISRPYKSLCMEVIGGNVVLTITHADILYYLHLLKEQQIQNSTWKYRIKRLFGWKRNSKTTLVKPTPEVETAQ